MSQPIRFQSLVSAFRQQDPSGNALDQWQARLEALRGKSDLLILRKQGRFFHLYCRHCNDPKGFRIGLDALYRNRIRCPTQRRAMSKLAFLNAITPFGYRLESSFYGLQQPVKVRCPDGRLHVVPAWRLKAEAHHGCPHHGSRLLAPPLVPTFTCEETAPTPLPAKASA